MNNSVGNRAILLQELRPQVLDKMATSLSVRGITKSYGQRRVLDNASFDLLPAEIHALVGANGAGKTTFAWLLAGRFRDYSGDIRVDDVPVHLRSRADALRYGIQIVTQEPALAPNLSVSQNIFLGNERASGVIVPFIRSKQLSRAGANVMREFDVDINPDAPLRSLSLEQRQAVDLIRAANRKPNFLVIDEPPLTRSTSLSLFFYKAINRLRDQGTAVLLITHHISNALNLATKITVLRDGRVVGTLRGSDTDAASIAELMFSLPPEVRNSGLEKTNHSSREHCAIEWKREDQDVCQLSVKDQCVTGLSTTPPDLASALLRAIARVGDRFNAVVTLNRRKLKIRSPHDALRAGVVYLSADRESEAVFPNLSVANNLTFNSLREFSTLGVIRRYRQNVLARQLAGRVGVDAARLDDRFSDLSGGNQQRILLGRAIATNGRLTLLDEPNRGLDLLSLSSLSEQIRDLSAPSHWVVVTSSDEGFLTSVSDEIKECQINENALENGGI